MSGYPRDLGGATKARARRANPRVGLWRLFPKFLRKFLDVRPQFLEFLRNFSGVRAVSPAHP